MCGRRIIWYVINFVVRVCKYSCLERNKNKYKIKECNDAILRVEFYCLQIFAFVCNLCFFFVCLLFETDKIKELRHFKERPAAEVMRVIIDAMRHCHSKDIVHRDLKPENIVFKDKDQEQLVIIDFGDAKEVEEHSTHDDFGMFYFACSFVFVFVFVWCNGINKYETARARKFALEKSGLKKRLFV